ncbi:MAG: TOBE domain-containing protein, partial [Candidatus Competibacteraceae bacterium]
RRQGERLEIGVRPEFLRLQQEPGPGTVGVTVSAVQDLGNFKIATVQLGAQALKVKVPEDQQVPAEQAQLSFTPELTKLYADGMLVG